MIRRCPQCGTATDDVYGFCIRCGHEFPKIENTEHTCPLCGFQNPDEADYCVKCGTPLVFKTQFEGKETTIKPIVIKKEVIQNTESINVPKTSSWIIILGYIFSILGGLLGLIIAIYLATRKDPIAKKHGRIQLGIFAIYFIILLALYLTGNFPKDILTNYRQLFAGNFTQLQR